jgi:hypothetical protein
MEPSKQLIDIFERFYKTKKPLRGSFADASYDLRILSTLHAEARGDIVTDVIRIIVSPNPELWKSAAKSFKLHDVVRIEADNEWLFTKPGS